MQWYENYSQYYILFQWCSSGLTPAKQIWVSKNFLPKQFAKIRKLFTVLYFIQRCSSRLTPAKQITTVYLVVVEIAVCVFRCFNANYLGCTGCVVFFTTINRCQVILKYCQNLNERQNQICSIQEKVVILQNKICPWVYPLGAWGATRAMLLSSMALSYFITINTEKFRFLGNFNIISHE